MCEVREGVFDSGKRSLDRLKRTQETNVKFWESKPQTLLPSTGMEQVDGLIPGLIVHTMPRTAPATYLSAYIKHCTILFIFHHVKLSRELALYGAQRAAEKPG